MGKWEYLAIGFDWDPPKADKILCWDDNDAGMEIIARLQDPQQPRLCDFLRQAAKLEWQLADSQESLLVLKRQSQN